MYFPYCGVPASKNVKKCWCEHFFISPQAIDDQEDFWMKLIATIASVPDNTSSVNIRQLIVLAEYPVNVLSSLNFPSTFCPH